MCVCVWCTQIPTILYSLPESVPTSSSTLDDNVGDEACTTCKYKVHVLYAVQAHMYVLLHAFLWWVELLHVGKHNYIIIKMIGMSLIITKLMIL